MARTKFALILLICLQLAVPGAYAVSDYNPARKLVRGFVNAVGCWVELGRQPIITSREEGQMSGATWGLVKGIGFTFGRAILGAYETITFLVPTYHPLVEPEFIFSDKPAE